MNKPMLLVGAAETALIATVASDLAHRAWWTALVGAALAVVVPIIFARLESGSLQNASDARTVGVGTVQAGAGERQVFVEVVAVSGETFIGKLARCGNDPDTSTLRPGLVVLVAFDPAEREWLSLPDDVLAVRAQWLASV